MVNGQGRLRIYQFVCGIANTFTDSQVISYSMKEHVSPITDSLPSWDVSLTVNNYDGYYNPDNPDSALVLAAPYTMLIAATSLSACRKQPPISGIRADMYSGISVCGVMG